MRQRSYAIIFVVVVVVGCLAAFLGGRLLWRNLGGSPQAVGAWTPPPDDMAAVLTAEPAGAAGTPAPPSQNGPTPPAVIRVTLTQIVAPTVLLPTPDLSTPTPDPFAPTAALFSPISSTALLTPTATGLPVGAEYALANPVRHSNGDCPSGNYILGQITDAKGNPLPNVTLLLVDEYGNRETKVSKAVAAEAGRYDFPLFGPPRKFTLAITDDAGRVLSPEVEVPVGSGAAANMACHWVDFRKR